MLTRSSALSHARSALETAGVEDAWLDAEVLLAHVLRVSRTDLHAQPEAPIPPSQADSFLALVQRRTRREPLAYIVGKREFYGLEFFATPAVLVPRPETESLVEAALEWVGRRLTNPATAQTLRIADVGSGSGCIAITLAKRLPNASVYAVDVSLEALKVAGENCRHHHVEGRVQLLAGHLLQPLPERVDLIVANLPYVSERDLATLQPEIRSYEPSVALTPGPDALALMRQLLCEAPGQLRPGGACLLEFSPPQRSALEAIAQEAFPTGLVRVVKDLAGLDRVLAVAAPG
ncbi:MAG: peptide chain release factor N(5)-glutamine methyltransferase [Dehalococcoidia bacterium]|nr:peptide chain release factor N(5)-glutamine methyltransferase [Dehalococcoidia bacterium]